MDPATICRSRIDQACLAIDAMALKSEMEEVQARLDVADWRNPPAMAALARRLDALTAQARALEARGEARLMAELLLDPACGPADRAALLADMAALADAAEAAVMSGEDLGDALVILRAGTGGEDAARFVSRMLRRVTGRASRMGLSCEEADCEEWGEGLRSITLHLRGTGAFGRMKGEAGKQRLVHVPPGSAVRHTSFCMIEVLPLRPAPEAVAIPESDIRIETYRATGPGGQHRNTTDSAVRITHLPTGIVASSTLKSQHVNRELAMATLAARVEDAARRDAEEASRQLRAAAGPAGFGGHARSIVLHPYALVRDERTGASTTRVAEWLAGGDISG